MSNPHALDLIKREIEAAIHGIEKCDHEIAVQDNALEIIRNGLARMRFEIKLARKRRFPNFNRAMEDEEEEIHKHLRFLIRTCRKYRVQRKDFEKMKCASKTRRSEFLQKISVMASSLSNLENQ